MFWRKARVEYVFLVPFVGFLLFFEIYPLINMAIRSFFDNNTGEFTFQNYVNVFTQPQFRTAIRNSLLFATACSMVGAVGGTFVGYIASHISPKYRNLLLSLYSLPLTLSGLVVAFSFIVLLGRNGVINLLVRQIFGLPRSVYFDVYSWYGLVVVYAFYQIPLMALTMAAIFLNLDRSLVEAARNLGANTFQVWRYVIIPVLAPGFLAGLSIQFAGMMGAFGTVLALVGGEKNLLSVQIYYHTSESTYNHPQAGALAVTLILIISLLLFTLNRLRHVVSPGG